MMAYPASTTGVSLFWQHGTWGRGKRYSRASNQKELLLIQEVSDQILSKRKTKNINLICEEDSKPELDFPSELQIQVEQTKGTRSFYMAKWR